MLASITTRQDKSLNNRMDECREVVTILKPEVIGITESCSKGKSEGDINLESFTPYIDDCRRGVILYITFILLQSAPCTELKTTDSESSIWSIITLNKRDKLLVGCIIAYIRVRAQLNKRLSCLLV